jgi:deoxyuridine 5'-triphosphate nucleotidohydrolase
MTDIKVDYFKVIDSELKAYNLGNILFNIKEVFIVDKVCNKIQVYTGGSDELCRSLNITQNVADDYITIDSIEVISDIGKYFDTNDFNDHTNIDFGKFLKICDKKYTIGFLRAFYEKNGKISEIDGKSTCVITCYNNENITYFADYFNVPYISSNMFNLYKITYTGVNILDIVGAIYINHTSSNTTPYSDFKKLINNEKPSIKYIKMHEIAVEPAKANYSDVGYDLTAIGIQKKINKKTILCNTGIKLDIPIGYYVEIVPRSSIIKSGYMLGNSIGIIDCSYKGELFIALVKIDDESPDIVFPFKCCQLIVRKQVFPDMLLISDMEESKRGSGGFGSSDKN